MGSPRMLSGSWLNEPLLHGVLDAEPDQAAGPTPSCGPSKTSTDTECSFTAKLREQLSPLLARTVHEAEVRHAPSRSALLHEADDSLFDRTALFHEIKRLLALAIPITYSAILSYGISLIGIAFVGRLGEFELSVALLATSFHNVTGYAIVAGFSGVLETVCGQSYGARRYRAVGIALQRGIVVALLLCTLVSAVWLLAARPLILLTGQEPHIADATATYLQLTCPALFAAAMTSVLVRYLLAQGHATQPTVASTVAVLLAPVYYHFLINTAGLGLHGAPLAQSALQMTLMVVLSLLTWRHHRRAAGTPRQTWHGWSTAALRGWAPYVRLGLPSVAMTVVEWSAFEVCVIEAGWLPEPSVSLSVMGLLLNIVTLAYLVPMGMGAAASSRVSNALGAGLVNAARRSAFAALGTMAGAQAILAGCLFVCRGGLVSALTTAADVVSAAQRPLLVACVVIAGDGVNATASGVLRGCGRQALSAWLSTSAFWCLGLPLGTLLAFRGPHAGVTGLWLGLVVGVYTIAGCNLAAIATTDWRRQADRAAALTRGGSSDLPPETPGGDELDACFVIDP